MDQTQQTKQPTTPKPVKLTKRKNIKSLAKPFFHGEISTSLFFVLPANKTEMYKKQKDIFYKKKKSDCILYKKRMKYGIGKNKSIETMPFRRPVDISSHTFGPVNYKKYAILSRQNRPIYSSKLIAPIFFGCVKSNITNSDFFLFSFEFDNFSVPYSKVVLDNSPYLFDYLRSPLIHVSESEFTNEKLQEGLLSSAIGDNGVLRGHFGELMTKPGDGIFRIMRQELLNTGIFEIGMDISMAIDWKPFGVPSEVWRVTDNAWDVKNYIEKQDGNESNKAWIDILCCEKQGWRVEQAKNNWVMLMPSKRDKSKIRPMNEYK